jgi:ABC-type branched-subunit amino acid transport system ATPase component
MPLLQTRRLTAFYGDFQALYGVDTTLDSSETIAIIGANGAGKSTLLKSIAGLIAGPADSVLLDGVPIGAPCGRHRQARHCAGARGQAAVSLAHPWKRIS